VATPAADQADQHIHSRHAVPGRMMFAATHDTGNK
jgi:hypothetical protein